jgi:AraC-like DNA-binding protein
MAGTLHEPPEARYPQTWDMSLLRHERLSAGAILKDSPGPLWVLLLDGSAEFETAGGGQRLSAGDAVLVDSRTARRISAVEELELAVADLRAVPAYPVPSPFVVSGFSDRHPGVARLVATCPLGEACRSALYTHSYAGLIGAAMVTSWLEAGEDGAEGGAGDAAVLDVLAALAVHPGEQWTLDRMARLVHLSRSALTARFRRAAGRTPMEILREIRMREARTLLSDGSQPVAQVAFAVGYGSTAAFSRAFSVHHGLAPLAWRSDALAASPTGDAKQPEPDSGGERGDRAETQRRRYAVGIQQRPTGRGADRDRDLEGGHL